MAMTVQTAVSRIQEATHDITEEYTTEEYLFFINAAIQQISSLLISAKYPTLLKEVTIREGDTVPANFATTAGSFPIRITGNRASIADPDLDEVVVRYYSTPENVEYIMDELPFDNDAINTLVVKTAVLYALNRNEYDITQDSALVQNLQDAIAASFR